MNCDCVTRHVIGCPNMRQPFPKKAPRRLQAQSAKRKALAPRRAAFVEQKLKEDPFCQACPVIWKWFNAMRPVLSSRHEPRPPHCTSHATQVHEPLTRARAPGDENILEPKNAISTCANGHAWIHMFPLASEQMGLLVSSRGVVHE